MLSRVGGDTSSKNGNIKESTTIDFELTPVGQLATAGVMEEVDDDDSGRAAEEQIRHMEPVAV